MQIGSYRVVEEIARGGMGVVYRAQGPDGEQVAIKLVLAAGLADPEDQVRFRREAAALEALDHPGILRVRSHGVNAGQLYMVMDLLPGPTLADVVGPEGPLSEARAIALGQRLAAALGHAHARGVVHRDLKPANVILRDDEPVLVDFGLVLLLDLEQKRLTETGTIMGSPKYMAPEQARGETNLGPAADLYGLGATLYYLLTGKPPFEGKGALEILKRVVGEDPLPLRELRPELSPALEAVVLRCLEKEPSQRYPTASALERALSAVPPSSGPVAATHPLSAVNRALSGALAAAGLLAIAALVALVSVWPSATSTTAQTDQRERVEALLEAGIANSEAGRHAEAIADFDKALELDPPPARADQVRQIRAEATAKLAAQEFSASGTRHNKAGRYAEALEDYDKAIDLDPSNAQTYADRGASKAKLKRFEEAILDYDKALELDPTNARHYLSRGGLKAALGRHDEAITDDYDKAIKLSPSNPGKTLAMSYASRGASKAWLKRLEEAIQDYDKTLELGLPPEPADKVKTLRDQAATGLANQSGRPLTTEAQKQRAQELSTSGDRHFEAGRFVQALEDYDKAIELDPSNAQTYTDRGASKANLGRHEEALEDHDKAIELDPSNVVAYANRGASKKGLGRFEEAIQDYDTALELDPRNTLHYLNRGILKAILDRHDEAIQDYDKALELDSSNSVEILANSYAGRGLSKAQLGRYAKAIEDYDKALELGGLSLLQAEDLRQRRGKAATDLAEEEIEDCTKAIKLDPSNPQAYANRGKSKAKLGRYAEAIEDYDTALELDPDFAPAYANRGTSKAKLGRHAEAIEDYDTAIKLDPSNPQAYANRGSSKAQLGRFSEAILDLDTAIELDPSNPQAYANRGSSKAQLGRSKEAIEDYSKALELDPSSAYTYVSRGFNKANLGRYAEAIEDYDKAFELGALPPQVTDAVKELRAEAAASLEGN